MRYVILFLSIMGLPLSYILATIDAKAGFFFEELMHTSLCVILFLICLTGIIMSCHELPHLHRRYDSSKSRGKNS